MSRAKQIQVLTAVQLAIHRYCRFSVSLQRPEPAGHGIAEVRREALRITEISATSQAVSQMFNRGQSYAGRKPR
jgi:hypothetical protein